MNTPITPAPVPSRPFELPAHFSVWITCEPKIAHLHTFKAHLEVDGLCRTVESKAFHPGKAKDATQAWLEFMSLTGNIMITSVMPPDMQINFEPILGGGMRVIDGKERA